MEALQTNTRISLSNILVTTDFSQALKELPCRLRPLWPANTRRRLLWRTRFSPEPHLSVPVDPLPADADPTCLEAEGKLAEFALGNSLGVRPAEMLLERGDVWNVISDIIQKNKIDLVVTGTHGRQGLKKLVLGSEAEKIYRRATCPVLTIGPQVPPLSDTNWKLETILFPTDGSETSLKALPYALSLAEENQANLIFLRLMPMAPIQYRESDEASAREAMRALVPAEAEDWCKPEFVARFDFPAEGILGFAKEREVNLIVMGVEKVGRQRCARTSAVANRLPGSCASSVPGADGARLGSREPALLQWRV